MKYKLQMLSLILILFASPSCSNDDNSDQKEIQGTWQLFKFEDFEDGTVLDPNDGRPVQITFRSDGKYDGVKGNNEIQGAYRLENDELIFAGGTTTEISNTEWEEMFSRSLNKSIEGNEYVMPYSLEESELILDYEAQSQMFFIKI